MEISKVPDKEFNVMVKKMLTKLRRIMNRVKTVKERKYKKESISVKGYNN